MIAAWLLGAVARQFFRLKSALVFLPLFDLNCAAVLLALRRAWPGVRASPDAMSDYRVS
jgi:hypothetical protein